jgi:hypothetical protein
MRAPQTLIVALLSLLPSTLAFAAPVESWSISVELREEAQVLPDQPNELQFRLESGKVLTFSCGKDQDDFYNNTFLSWPGLKEKIENSTAKSYKFVENEVGVFSRMDFYCDTMTGKNDEAIYRFVSNVRKAAGKKVELVAKMALSSVRTATQVIESAAIVQLDVLQNGKTIATYFGRPTPRESKEVEHLSTTTVADKK